MTILQIAVVGAWAFACCCALAPGVTTFGFHHGWWGAILVTILAWSVS